MTIHAVRFWQKPLHSDHVHFFCLKSYRMCGSVITSYKSIKEIVIEFCFKWAKILSLECIIALKEKSREFTITDQVE